MAVKNKRLVSHIYQKTMRNEFTLRAMDLIGPTTKFQLSYQGNCNSGYTTMSGKEKDTFRVVLGGQLISKVAHLPDTFTSKAILRSFIKPTKMAFKAIFYHEMGHVLFSDMTLAKIIEYDEKTSHKYRGFIFSLQNIIEDPVIELAIIKYIETKFPYIVSPRKYFQFAKDNMFKPQCEEYVDNHDQHSFLNYLLLCLRCGKSEVKNTNEIYDKYKENLLPLIKDCLREPNATERQAKIVILADWIINNITEFDWTSVPMPDDIKPKPGSKPSGSPMSSDIGAGDMPSGFGDTPEDGTGSKSGHSEGDSGKGADEDKKEEEKKEEEEKDSGEEGKSSMPEDDFVPDIDDIFEDLINSSYDHEFVVAKDEYEIINSDELNEKLDEEIEKSRDCVNDISKFLSLFQGRVKPRRTEGFTKGRLNIRRAMKDEAKEGCDIRLFTQNKARGQAADLAVCEVADNSGSMGGDKSRLASRATLALAQACEWAKIPFECMAFTKTEDNSSGTSITIIEKSFKDTFEDAKPYFAVNDSRLIGYLQSERNIPTFRGNSEEVNLYHIGNEFMKCGHTTKLMFVFCDGQTTGSAQALKQVVQNMIANGIYVIGIGIMSNDVEHIYPYYKVFKSYQDLQDNLAPYLVETLSYFATNGR